MNPYPKEIVSDQKGNVLRVLLSNGETWLRRGKCKRCGKCCLKGQCTSLDYENLNGELVAKCLNQWSKPWQCMFAPYNPYDPKEKFEGCGYYWYKLTWWKILLRRYN